MALEAIPFSKVFFPGIGKRQVFFLKVFFSGGKQPWENRGTQGEENLEVWASRKEGL